MQISKIELFYVKIPLDRNKPGFFSDYKYFEPSWIPGFRQSEMRFYLLRLTTDNGHEGYSAMPAMSTERHGLGPTLGSYMLGMNPLDTATANQRIQEFAFIGMRNGWIETAIWDLIGKIKKKPIYELFGGTGGDVFPYASTGATHGHDQNKIQEIVRQRQNDGFKGIKLRTKSDELAPMVDFVGAARKVAGNDMKMMVDVNQGWPVDIVDETPKWSVDFATQFAIAMEQFNLYWLEEPLNKGNFKGLAQLRKATSTPISGGEMNSSWTEFNRLFELECLDIYQPDAILIGGTYAGGVSVAHWVIQEMRKRNAEINEHKDKLKFCPHTWTTGLGFALALQIVGILKEEERSLLEYPLEGDWKPENWARFIRNDIISRDESGRIKIPDGPGLGIEIDMDVIRRFGKRIYNGTKRTVGTFTLFDRGWKQTMYLKQKKEEALKKFAKAKFEIPQVPF